MVTRIQITDTHCHLNFPHFDGDLEMVVGRAREAGIEKMLIPGIDLESSQAALTLADQFAEIHVAIGVHPNSASSWDRETYHTLEQMACHPKVVAIGEIGLDYYRKGAPVDSQQWVFRQQLDLACRLNLPVIIHNRDAAAEVQEIITDWMDTLNDTGSALSARPGVFHSFAGDLTQAKWAVESNFYVGITGPVTYKNAEHLQQIVRSIPLDMLLIETDSPYLPPHPHRGERNEPAHVAIIASKIAELRAVDVEDIARATSKNAAILFGWRKID